MDSTDLLAGQQAGLCGLRLDVEGATHLRGAVSRIARRLNAFSTSEGLTPTEASVLGLVVADGPIRLARLIEMEGLNPTMLSRVITKLRVLGLLTAGPDPEDLRVQRAIPTEEGIQAHARIKSARAKVVSESAALLPDDYVAALLNALPALDALAVELGRAVQR